MKTYWKTVEGFENYEVSDQGEVRNTKRGRVLKASPAKGGYRKYDLYKKGRGCTVAAHRVVAKAWVFNPKPDTQYEVNHIDEDKTNNHPLNLEWCTAQYNTIHSVGVSCIFTDPCGIEYETNCIKSFCTEHGLNPKCIDHVLAGRNQTHKRWTVRKSNV